MNGSSELTCADEQEIGAPARAQRQQIEREVGIAAQAEARLAAALALGHELRDDVDAAVEHVAQAHGYSSREM